MTKYQEFLESARVITEDLFNEVVNSLPECDLTKIAFDEMYDLDSQDEIAEMIINFILSDWNYVTSEEVNFEQKTFQLTDVECYKDLEEIVKLFSEWTITNYDEIKEWSLEQEKNKEKDILIHNYDFSNIPLEDIKEFLKKYEK